MGNRLILLGLLVLLVQGILWIDQGYWIPCNLLSVLKWLDLRPPSVGWVTAQQIIDWVLAFPLSAVPLALGFSIAWSGAASADHADRISDSDK